MPAAVQEAAVKMEKTSRQSNMHSRPFTTRSKVSRFTFLLLYPNIEGKNPCYVVRVGGAVGSRARKDLAAKKNH